MEMNREWAWQNATGCSDPGGANRLVLELRARMAELERFRSDSQALADTYIERHRVAEQRVAELERSCKPHLFVGQPPACTRCGEYDRQSISHTNEVSNLRGSLDAAEQRAATLQTEVDTITVDRDAWAEEALAREQRAIHSEKALAESERKRAELLHQLEDDTREQKMQDAWDDDFTT